MNFYLSPHGIAWVRHTDYVRARSAAPWNGGKLVGKFWRRKKIEKNEEMQKVIFYAKTLIGSDLSRKRKVKETKNDCKCNIESQ